MSMQLIEKVSKLKKRVKMLAESVTADIDDLERRVAALEPQEDVAGHFDEPEAIAVQSENADGKQ